MTTIACNREEMAADTQGIVNGLVIACDEPKMWIDNWRIVGAAGKVRDVELFRAWLRDGSDPTSVVRFCGVEALVLSEGGILFYNGNYTPIGAFHAVGSGAVFALNAMGHGKTPREAVAYAAKHDEGTGEPIQVMRLKDWVSDARFYRESRGR